MKSNSLKYFAIFLLVFALAATNVHAHPKTVRISVSEKGFSPSSISAEEGFPLTLIFTRRSRQGCGNKVVFPSLGIEKNLPLGKPVTVRVTPRAGKISFSCGMGMYKGSIVAVE